MNGPFKNGPFFMAKTSQDTRTENLILQGTDSSAGFEGSHASWKGPLQTGPQTPRLCSDYAAYKIR